MDIIACCVKLFSNLEQEFQAATSAISRNRLGDLEESLWRQETTCAMLKRAMPAIPAASPPPTLLELREAVSRVRVRAQIYEKVVIQSSRSTAILQHLCSLYRNAAQHPGRAMYKSISREV
jgi:hypothetical protein